MVDVLYTCGECGKSFIVKQGSRRQYCDTCGMKRIREGGHLRGAKPKRAKEVAARE